jgi:hypothetical protein
MQPALGVFKLKGDGVVFARRFDLELLRLVAIDLFTQVNAFAGKFLGPGFDLVPVPPNLIDLVALFFDLAAHIVDAIRQFASAFDEFIEMAIYFLEFVKMYE